MHGRRWIAAGGLALAILATARAAPEPETPEARADRVVAAHEAGEPVAPMATRGDPDLWLVVEALCVRGQREAAAALAAAAHGKDFARLAEYVAGWRDAEGDGAIREAVAAARNALAAKDHDRAVAALVDARPREDTLLAVFVPYVRAEVLEAAGRHEEGAAMFVAAARAAERVGWLRRAYWSYSRAVHCAHGRADDRTLVRWAEAQLRLLLARSNGPEITYNVAVTRHNLGSLLTTLGEYGPARDHLRRALEILEPLRTKDLRHAALHATALAALAVVHRELGEYDEAARLLERAVAIHRSYRHAPGLARTLGDLGYVEWLRGSPDRGLELLEEALPLMRSTKDGAGEARVLNWIGVARARAGDTAGAREAIARALEVAQRVGARWEEARARESTGHLVAATESLAAGIEHLEAARALYRAVGARSSVAFLSSELAMMLASRGEIARARTVLDEAVEAAGENRLARADVLKNRGDLSVDQGEYAAAAEDFARATKLLEKSASVLGRANLQISEGCLAFATGRLRDALAAFEKARDLYRRLGDHNGLALANGNLGLVHTCLGNLEDALALHEAALDFRRRTGNRIGEASALGLRADVRSERGETARALTDCERALDLARRVGDRGLEAESLQRLAQFHLALGDLVRGREEVERSLAILGSLGDRIGLARGRNILARLFLEQGRWQEAKRQHEAALVVQEQLGAERDAAGTRGNLGVVHSRLREFAEARALFRATRESHVRLGDEPTAVHHSVNLAQILAAEERFEEAVAAYGPVLEQAERLGVRNTLVYALSGLSVALAGLGDDREAIDVARRAAEESRLLVGGFGEQQGAGLRSDIAECYGFHEVGVRSALRLRSAEDLCFFLEVSRAGSLLETLRGRERLREATIPADLRKEEQEARLDESEAVRENRLALATGKADAIREARRRLEERRDRVRTVVDRIQRTQKLRAGIIYPRADSLEEIRAALRPGETLVSYGLHGDLASALVLTGETTRTVDLGTAEEIDALCRRVLWIGRAGARGVVVPAAARTDAARRARSLETLRRKVVDPLKFPPETRRVLVSPAGILSYVPFRLLLDAPEIVHVPSGSTYRLLMAERTAVGKDVLALGDPDYARAFDAAGRAVTAFEGALPMLPATRREVLAVGEVTLLREKATEAELVRSLGLRPRWKAVHLACHGLVDPERPARSALALTPDEKDDGLLSRVDLCLLEIPADLVVLSACETARGRVYGAEGIVGLTSAFLHAGASTVLCSLWKVDDEATQALMAKFYELWRTKGLSAAAALAGAQAHVRARAGWVDPYFWAAWVIWGRGD